MTSASDDRVLEVTSSQLKKDAAVRAVVLAETE